MFFFTESQISRLTRGFPSDQRKSPSMVLSLRPVHWYSLYLSKETNTKMSKNQHTLSVRHNIDSSSSLTPICIIYEMYTGPFITTLIHSHEYGDTFKALQRFDDCIEMQSKMQGLSMLCQQTWSFMNSFMYCKLKHFSSVTHLLVAA